MRRVYILFILLIFTAHIFASDYTDQLLNEAINNFSNQNYEVALELIDTVLELEPENEDAVMYKKTIEDAQKADLEKKAAQLLEQQKGNSDSNNSETTSDNNAAGVVKENSDKVNLTTYFGLNTTDKSMVLQQELKLVFGLPIIDLKVSSTPFDYNLETLSINDFPGEEIINYKNYYVDIAAGARYKNEYGYFDAIIGASDLSLTSSFVVPYIGYDMEFITWDLGNLWLGSSGKLYNYNNEFINNYEIEVSGGFKLKFFDIGLFYNKKMLSSSNNSDFTKESYGIILGFNF